MSNMSASQFIHRLGEDPNLRSQLGITPTMPLDEFQAKAAAGGYNYTSEEILAAAEAQQDSDLSDAALNKVTGGARSNTEVTISITVKF
ncbi:MAG TPA: Nif11-like leader peptide family RiPP precursor [Chloroflexia bacterium]|nr:Nif11-like leader peptide family RiPP precursor [Chloroflexia bacterium]